MSFWRSCWANAMVEAGVFNQIGSRACHSLDERCDCNLRGPLSEESRLRRCGAHWRRQRLRAYPPLLKIASVAVPLPGTVKYLTSRRRRTLKAIIGRACHWNAQPDFAPSLRKMMAAGQKPVN